jgi:hypothetical protein
MGNLISKTIDERLEIANNQIDKLRAMPYEDLKVTDHFMLGLAEGKKLELEHIRSLLILLTVSER